MAYRDTTKKMTKLRQKIAGLRTKMRKLQKTIAPEEVSDYTLEAAKGSVRLSQLFGDKEYLFVIHNMGAGCRYCTLWADGFNGILPHLEDRAAFVLSSPDDPAKQARFKAKRRWRVRMVSHLNSSFAADMGYGNAKGWLPGVSVFRKRGRKIFRVSDTRFGPGDDFCSLWHFFDLIPEGPAGWQPQYRYA